MIINLNTAFLNRGIKHWKSALEQYRRKPTKFAFLYGSVVYISDCSNKLPSTYTTSLEGRSIIWIDYCGLIFQFLHPVCFNLCYLGTTRSYAAFLLFLAYPFRNAPLFLSFTLNSTSLEIRLYSKHALIFS